MPKINVYLPEPLAEAVRDAQVPVSAICQAALERAVRDVTSARGIDEAPGGSSQVGLFGRFTPRARQAVALAEDRAHQTASGIGTEHLLVGILDEAQNVAVHVLTALDVEPADVRAEVLATMAAPAAAATGRPRFEPLAKLALELAAKEALGLGHNYVGCEHLLLGILAVEDGNGSQVLRRMGVELRTTRQAVLAALIRLPQAPPPRPAGPPDPALARILERLDTIERRLAG